MIKENDFLNLLSDETTITSRLTRSTNAAQNIWSA